MTSAKIRLYVWHYKVLEKDNEIKGKIKDVKGGIFKSYWFNVNYF